MCSERSARRAWAWLAFALTSVLAAAAFAHGPPPTITRVVAVDSLGPRVVGTTEGLALRRGDRFMYLCQSLFGDEAEAPAASTGGDVFVAGTRDLYRLDPEGRVTALGRPELARSFVLRLVPSPGGRVLALRLEGGTTDLRPLDGSGPIWSDEAIYDSITPDDASLWLARSAGTEGHVIRLGDDGTTLRSLDVPLESGERISQVREIGGVMYLTLVKSSGGRVVTLDGSGDAGTMTLVLTSESQISGPVVAGSRAWLAADGSLHRVYGARAEPVATAEHIAALLPAGDRAFVAVRTALLELGEGGPGAKVVDMVDFEPPDLDLVPEALRDTCQSEWLVLRADLEWVGAIPAASPREGGTGAPVSGLRASGSGGGCGLGGGVPPAAGSMALGYLASALLARRATRRR